MSEHTISLSGMSCGSCERIIERVLQKHSAQVKSIDANTGKVVFEINEGTQIHQIVKDLEEKGFPEGISGERGNWENVLSFVSNSISGNSGFEVENAIMNFSIISGIALFVLSTIFLFFIKGKMDILGFAPLVFLTIVFAVATTASYHHLRSYKKRMSCQNGMMVGMVSGMIIGFLSGALIGATNGMFAGSVVGMALGIYFGLELGKCCGVMGGIEGIMAGLMSGLMGAMSSVMLVADNLVAALFIIFAISVFILGGASYMMRKEAGKPTLNELDAKGSGFVFCAVILFTVLIGIMLMGPKAGVTFV